MGEQFLTFDDILIVPDVSDIESRSEINTSVNFLGTELSVPIISANMDFVTGAEMVNAMHANGGMGIMHRFHASERDYYEEMVRVGPDIPLYISVGIRDISATMDFIRWIVKDRGVKLQGVCIDVAHGHHAKVASLCEMIKGSVDEDISNLKVIAGNVATGAGVEFLANSGADAVKVGIGAGSVCTTRTVAGVGIPQFSAILECVEAAKQYQGLQIIADGGIRTSGDIAKALAAGADVVMLGNMLAGTDEAPGELITHTKWHEQYTGDANKYVASSVEKFKRYRGQASFGTNGEKYVKEGIEGLVPYKGPVAPIVEQIKRGLQSSMSYVGARNLSEFQEFAKFVEVSSHTLMENSTRVREW